MSLADFLFAAKPPVGTPPFAPPHPNTGGANPPTTPETLPVKQGLSGFLDRFMNPQNALGQFGRALVMAGGSPIGDAYQYMDKAKEQSFENDYKRQQLAEQMRKSRQPHTTQVGNQFGIVDENTGAFTPTFTAPKPEDAKITLARQYGATEGQIKDYALGQLNNPIAVQGFDNEGRPTITFVPRSQALGGSQPPATPGALAPKPAGGDLYSSLVQQESGGNYGAIGPQTPYGRAQGGAQMLPSTAQGMAKKLGVPWQPEMMTQATPEAIAYQNKLGQAYLAEGLEKTGNERDALRYYHGGPNRALWKEKTNRYADEVLARQSVARPKTRADYDALPVGTRYIAPDGSKKVKSQ